MIALRNKNKARIPAGSGYCFDSEFIIYNSIISTRIAML